MINAGDPDDEGQLIVDEVLGYLGNTKPVKRVFVNDNIEKNIRRAFENLKDNRECCGAGRSAYARQMADMCFGINETRLATKKLGKLLSVGRVQTPTIGLVVERDRQIENHEKRKFYTLFEDGQVFGVNGQKFEISLKFEPLKSFLSEEKYIFDREVLEIIEKSLQGFRGHLTVKEQKKKKNPPLPYNLTQLQADMSKKYKMSASKTLDVTQSLRDKYKAITYNRSDSQYLKNEHHQQAPSVLATAMKNLGEKWELDFSLKSKTFNDKNVTAHHGIIPQDIPFDFNSLSKDEQKVYRAIVERYAMQFREPVVKTERFGEIEVKDGKLVYKMSFEVDDENNKSFKHLFSDIDEEEKENDGIENNSILPVGKYDLEVQRGEVIEQETKSPARYTEGTLIKDMASIAKYVTDSEIKEVLKRKDDGKKGENGGIGTTATRASIIEKLKSRGYIEDSKGKIVSTQLARDFYKLLPNEIKGADLTAKWWLMQQEIENGAMDVNAIQRSVVEVFNSHKDSSYKGVDFGTSYNKKIVGKCPKCGKNVVYNGKSFQCESNKYKKQDDGSWVCEEGCQFYLVGFAGKRFTESQVKKLLDGQEVELKGLKSRNPSAKKKTYSKKFKLLEGGELHAYF